MTHDAGHLARWGRGIDPDTGRHAARVNLPSVSKEQKFRCKNQYITRFLASWVPSGSYGNLLPVVELLLP